VPLIRIEEAADPRLADYRALSSPERTDCGGTFVAEGRLVVRRLLTRSRFATRSVLVTPPALAALADVLETRAPVPVFLAPQPVMNAIAGFNIHRGCLAIGERPEPGRWHEIAALAHHEPPIVNHQSRSASVLIALERLANADNVGGIFRSAAAFGVSGVLLDSTSTDPLYRKAIRTSMGATLQVPFARAEPWPDVLHTLRRDGFAVVGMTPVVGAQPLQEVVNATGRRPTVLVLGHEGDGLTTEALSACEFRARIDVSSVVDSLNVAAAAAIALYEFAGSADVRRRR
jgi:tRNA G18 (ribose-2'-O)-methylase SpoU